MPSRIHHLGIAVRSLDEAVPFYRDTLGMAFQGTEDVPEFAVKVAFLKVGESRIELLEPTSREGMIARFLAERGPGFHHLAYEVEDLEAAIRSCEARGAKMIDRAPRPGAHGARVAFMDPESSQSVLTELCQVRRPRRGSA
jgi:methylmalonyl-CoA/ethylmalonyl-CoA epimerase